METEIIALYMRLSLEDKDITVNDKNESSSISNQRKILMEYINNSKELLHMIPKEYIDDGYSGLNFKRPSFKKMLDEITAQNIKCIIVKDLSRLGRNYIESGNFIERIFPFFEIRFISINDNYDSNKNNTALGIDIGFSNILNALYSKDLSVKTKKSKEMLTKKGAFLGCFPPYGYIKSKENKHKLIIDEEASQTVKRIFSMIISGEKCIDIARKFNNEKIISPIEHIKKIHKKTPSKNKIYWSSAIIRKIISNESYLGKTISKKSHISNINQKIIAIPKEKYIIIENTHKAIISQEDFNCANEKILKYNKKPYKKDNSKIFYKKLKCGGCGHLLYNSDSKIKRWYCRTSSVTNKENCFSRRIPEDIIVNVITESIKKMNTIAIEVRNLIDIAYKENFDYKKLIREKETQIKKLNNNKFCSFQSYSTKKITEETYKMKINVLNEKILNLENELKEIKLNYKDKDSNKKNNFINNLIQYKSIEYLSRNIVDNLINSIIIDKNNNIKIIWNFKDSYC